MTHEDWQKLITELNIDLVTLRDQRYNQIIHMVRCNIYVYICMNSLVEPFSSVSIVLVWFLVY